MFCIYCGGVMEEDDLFCGICGKPISNEEIVKIPNQVPVPSPSPPVQIEKPRKNTGLKVVLVLLVLIIGMSAGGFVVFRFFIPEAHDDRERLYEDFDYVDYFDEDIPEELIEELIYEMDYDDAEESALPLDPNYVRLTVESFLADYRTLFLDRDETSDYLFGKGAMWYDGDLSAALSHEMRMAPYIRTFNNFPAGDEVANPAIGSLLRAVSFQLIDVNNSGMPEIFIEYMSMFANGPWHPNLMFTYFNGQFHKSGALLSPQFFINEDGEIIVIEWSWTGRASYFSLVNGRIDLEFIAEWDAWVGDDDFVFDLDNPRLPGGLGGNLTYIQPLSNLESSITNSLAPIIRAEVINLPPIFPSAQQQAVPNLIEATSESYFILPFSHYRLLTDRDLIGLSDAELRLARNEIFARHGRRFADEELQAYFDSMPWYVPLLPLGEEPVVSELELSNAEFIQGFESGR